MVGKSFFERIFQNRNVVDVDGAVVDVVAVVIDIVVVVVESIMKLQKLGR